MLIPVKMNTVTDLNKKLPARRWPLSSLYLIPQISVNNIDHCTDQLLPCLTKPSFTSYMLSFSFYKNRVNLSYMVHAYGGSSPRITALTITYNLWTDLPFTCIQERQWKCLVWTHIYWQILTDFVTVSLSSMLFSCALRIPFFSKQSPTSPVTFRNLFAIIAGSRIPSSGCVSHRHLRFQRKELLSLTFFAFPPLSSTTSFGGVWNRVSIFSPTTTICQPESSISEASSLQLAYIAFGSSNLALTYRFRILAVSPRAYTSRQIRIIALAFRSAEVNAHGADLYISSRVSSCDRHQLLTCLPRLAHHQLLPYALHSLLSACYPRIFAVLREILPMVP